MCYICILLVINTIFSYTLLLNSFAILVILIINTNKLHPSLYNSNTSHYIPPYLYYPTHTLV